MLSVALAMDACAIWWRNYTVHSVPTYGLKKPQYKTWASAMRWLLLKRSI